MKRSLVALAMSAFLSCLAGTVNLKSGKLEAVIEQKGASLESLTYNGNLMTIPGQRSMAEQLLHFRDVDGKAEQYAEDFADYEFRVLSSSKSMVSLALRGAGICKDIRVEKTFTLVPKSNVMRVDYVFHNIGGSDFAIGWATRNFFAPLYSSGSVQTLYMPAASELRKLQHPSGKTSRDEFGADPAFGALTVHNEEKKLAVQMRLPVQELDGFYGWFSRRDSMFTNEWYVRQVNIPAGQSRSFSLEVECYDALPALPDYAKAPQVQRRGDASPYYRHLAKGFDVPFKLLTRGAQPYMKRHLDLRLEKQFMPSVRIVSAKADMDLSRLAIYELENGVSDLERPVPFAIRKAADGTQKIVVGVPGINELGYASTKMRNGRALTKQKGYADACALSMDIRLELEADKPGKQEPSLASASANLVYNGNFEKAAANDDWPDGYVEPRRLSKRGDIIQWSADKDAPEGKRYLHLQVSKGTCRVQVHQRLEPHCKYKASALVRSQNPAKGWAVACFNCIGEDGKPFNENSRFTLRVDRGTYGWTRLETEFYAPEGCSCGCFQFSCASAEQFMDIDDLTLVPQPLLLEPKAKIDMLREEVMGGHYKPLKVWESVSHKVATPHVPFFRNSAEALDGILYLSVVEGTNECTNRRFIVELAQRMDLSYQYIPLLKKIKLLRAEANIGVYKPQEYFPELEEYTLECIRQVKGTPRLVIVQQLNLKKSAQPEFTAILKGLKDKGANFLFMDCQDVPAELLGKAQKLPPELVVMPVMRNVKPSFIKFYKDKGSCAVTCTFSSSHYLDYRGYPCITAEVDRTKQRFPDYWGREYPGWEYMYQPILKSLRMLGGLDKVAATDARDNQLTFRSSLAGSTKLTVEYFDLNRYKEGESVQELNLAEGAQTVAVAQPALPGGVHIAHYYLRNAEGKTLDAGAWRFDTPAQPAITALQFPKDDYYIHTPGKPLDLKVCCQAKGSLRVLVEDTSWRVVAMADLPASDLTAFRLVLPPPYSRLYRVRAELRNSDGVLIDRKNGEFACPLPMDTQDMSGLMWMGRKEVSHALADLGFDYHLQHYSGFDLATGVSRAYLDAGVMPATINGGRYYENDRDYRGDFLNDKTVRNPCFTDPVKGKEVEDTLTGIAKAGHFDYFSIRNHMLSDETFLGACVCYSPHCLADFRKLMAETYGDVAKLNATWGTAFASFDEVTPKQIRELKDMDNLAPWLEHKVFMCDVFARNYVGRCARAIKSVNPDSRIGLSGTQNPGYSYDWSAMMKYVDFLSYYSGIQVKMVHDFSMAHAVTGQWGGGYVAAHLPFEPYEHATTWLNLIQGANMTSNWHGSAMNGDLTPTINLQFYSDALLEAKRGIAKLVLSAKPAEEEIAILYKHSSCMASLATIGSLEFLNSQTSWKAILDDLKCRCRFVTADKLQGLKAKILILSCALTLSDAELDSIEAFVKNGGLVIADVLPGLYDEHGVRRERAKVQQLFGKYSPATRLRNVVKNQENYRMPEGETLFENWISLDKGKVLTLGYSVCNYFAVTLGGTGGETEDIKLGQGVFRNHALAVIGKAVGDAGVRANFRVDTAEGKPYPCTTMLRKDGDNQVIALCTPALRGGQGVYSEIKPDKAILKLWEKGHVYDVRAGKYIGFTAEFPVEVLPGSALIYVVSPKKLGEFQVSCPKLVDRGKLCALDIKSKGNGGHVFYVNVIAPDGKDVRCYRKALRLESGSGRHQMQFAFNDQPGTWKVNVKCVDSGVVKTCDVVVK